MEINGEDITDLPPERRRIGLVPQDYALFPHLNVYRNIAYGLRGLEKEEKDRKVREIAERLGIALVVNPRVLLLDEPLSAVDLRTKKQLVEVLSMLKDEFRVPVLHVTHDLLEAALLADEVAVMMNGRIVESGRLEELFSSKNDVVRDFLSAKALFERIKL